MGHNYVSRKWKENIGVIPAFIRNKKCCLALAVSFCQTYTSCNRMINLCCVPNLSPPSFNLSCFLFSHRMLRKTGRRPRWLALLGIDRSAVGAWRCTAFGVLALSLVGLALADVIHNPFHSQHSKYTGESSFVTVKYNGISIHPLCFTYGSNFCLYESVLHTTCLVKIPVLHPIFFIENIHGFFSEFQLLMIVYIIDTPDKSNKTNSIGHKTRDL